MQPRLLKMQVILTKIFRPYVLNCYCMLPIAKGKLHIHIRAFKCISTHQHQQHAQVTAGVLYMG